ncbi:hypothetical protein L596_005167 [Steinernema carpocapsae]|uniref:Fe2OG dioxygenase domain-containing protein n=1 Tax=Steinernema carpocapsae TaxID=34508 RepID=A0A4U8UZQ0_STECR|nr:hypothetical protein L596_005167 [Steinernema carpocapsae]
MEHYQMTCDGDAKKSANDYIVGNAPATIRYIPNFISEEDEEFLLNCVYSSPSPKWQQLLNRRLQNWGGLVNSKGLIKDGPLPHWLDSLMEKIVNFPDTFPSDKRPNHVLINEYKPGQGILPHTDGSAYYPLISTISLGSHTLLDFYHKPDIDNITSLEDRYIGSVLVKPRSLILICDDAYEMHHGIDERSKDIIDSNVFNAEKPEEQKEMERQTRVSLTIRHCPKVSKFSVGNLLTRRS